MTSLKQLGHSDVAGVAANHFGAAFARCIGIRHLGPF
jgi:hypothetical protein